MDENERVSEEKPGKSEKTEIMDNPQPPETIRGLADEKESLEKRHGEEMEALKEDFSNEKNIVFEKHDEHSSAGASRSSMVDHGVQSSMMRGNAGHNDMVGSSSYNVHPISDSTRSVLNGWSSGSHGNGSHIGTNVNPTLHGEHAEYFGTSSSPLHNSSLSNMALRDTSSNTPYDGVSSGHQTNGIHRAGIKNTRPSWNPTFYAHNLFPPGGTTMLRAPSGTNVYDVSLELRNGSSVRMDADNLASQIRPDLDLEDRLEQQREFLQERFAEDRRLLRQNIEDEFVRRYEGENRKHHEVVQSLQKKILELEYQRKEVEVKWKHEKESLELKFERQKTEYETNCRKQSEEHRNKNKATCEAEMLQQKETYEGIITKLKNDVKALTEQLEEMNENLKHEKDNLVAAFEKEIADFKEREKERSNSELIAKLQSEISLLTSVNKSLREEIDSKENEKQELESLMKEERSRIELSYEKQISEIEAHFESEKQAIILQYEETVGVLLNEEKNDVVANSQKLNQDLLALQNENKSLREIVEKSYKIEEQASEEHSEFVQSLIEEKEFLKTQVEKLVAKQQSNYVSREEYDRYIMKANSELKESQEISEKVNRAFKHALEENEVLVKKVEELRREVDELKRENFNGSAIMEEKGKLLTEVAKLNVEMEKMVEDIQEKERKEIAMKEKINKVEDCLQLKENENTQLKIEKMESQNKLAMFERQIEDLKGDLASTRRKRVELDEENCNLKKEKAEMDGKLVVLQTSNEDLVQDLQKIKQKVCKLEEESTAMKLEKLELQQELRLTRMKQRSYQEVAYGVSDSDSSVSVSTSDETGQGRDRAGVKKKSSLEKQILKLKREKLNYEMSVESLKKEIDSLEKEALIQIEHNKAISAEFVSTKRDFERNIEDQKRERESVQESVMKVRHEEIGIKNDMALLRKRKTELEHVVELLRAEEERLEHVSDTETQRIGHEHEMKYEKLQREISELESSKSELRNEIERLEQGEAMMRCSMEDIQHESQLLSQRISQMKESVWDIGRQRVSISDEKASDDASSLGFNDVKEEISKLRRDRDGLIRSVNDLERKQTNLDISVESAEKNRQLYEKETSALSRKRSELESMILALDDKKLVLETRIAEHSETSDENDTSAQRKEIELLRSELEVIRASYEDMRSMYHEAHYEGKSKVEVVDTELQLAEDSLMRLKRERLELEKIISTLLRQKTELESDVSMIVDSKYRDDRDTSSVLREESLNLDNDLVRLRNQVTDLHSVMSKLADSKTITEHELRSLETRKERVDSNISGMEARLMIGQPSPVSWAVIPPKDSVCVLTSRDDLKKQLSELREQMRSLEADLFKLRRKSGDGIDTRSRAHHSEDALGVSGVKEGCIGTSVDARKYVGTSVGDMGLPSTMNVSGGRYGYSEGLQQDIDGLAQQKSKLSSEVHEMKLKKTDLDAQVTNLEYQKLGLEQSGRLVTGRENEVEVEGNFTEDHSVKMDFVNYSVEQMQDLRKKNKKLEDKLGTLENRLHEARDEMEKQTLDFQKELKLIQISLMSQQQNESDYEQLNVILGRLKKFIEESKLSATDKLYDDIKNDIAALNNKVEENSGKVEAIQAENLKEKRNVSGRKDVGHSFDEISAHIQDAETNVERYSKIVSYLQQENADLMDVVSRLRKRLMAAGRAHEVLKRKKLILQQLLKTVSISTGEDLIKQSNLIFELDKDVTV